MPADFICKAGDSNPAFTDTLTLSDGTVPPITSVAFSLRSLASAAQIPLTGPSTLVNAVTGAVQYQPTAADIATPGNYLATWTATLTNGSVMTFPTQGYLWVSIEPNLTAAPQGIVGLTDVKEYLGIPSTDRTRDARLIRFIAAVEPLIEMIIGPVIPKIYEEWYDGGSNLITLGRQPSNGFGCSPVLNVIAVSEYRGPIEYPLALIASPVFGSIYSVFCNPLYGTLTRRTAGGRTLAFMPGRESIHCIYQAGQAVTPPNVTEAVLEAVRINYMTTQPTGAGHRAQADADSGPSLGFFLPRRISDLLSPARHGPAFG